MAAILKDRLTRAELEQVIAAIRKGIDLSALANNLMDPVIVTAE